MTGRRPSTDEDAKSVGRADGDTIETLLERNRVWAASKTYVDADFFQRLVGQQNPRYFWIGCADSRVPATEIVDLDPGEMFVHRNVANLAAASDPSFAAALQFAVEVLRVEHIIVVGHYGCGGIQATMAPAANDAIGAWLKPVRECNHANPDGTPRNTDGLCERNVVRQVEALATNPVVLNAWDHNIPLTLHGWIYAIGDGLLKPLCNPVAKLRRTFSHLLPIAA